MSGQRPVIHHEMLEDPSKFQPNYSIYNDVFFCPSSKPDKSATTFVVNCSRGERKAVESGEIVWKHFRVPLPPGQDPSKARVHLENFTHPLRETMDNLKYDPRHLKVTTRYFEFDAPAGDHIFFRLGWV